MEIETKVLEDLVATVGNDLIKDACNGNLDDVRKVVKGDYLNPLFQRGCLHGMSMILDCKGLPAFLTGDAVRALKLFLIIAGKKIDAAELKEAVEKAI